MNTLTVLERSRALRRRIHLAVSGKICMSSYYHAILFKAYQDAPRARAPDEITRAVDRIDNPAATVGPLLRGAFFPQHAVFRKCRAERFHNQLLAGLVGHGHGR